MTVRDRGGRFWWRQSHSWYYVATGILLAIWAHRVVVLVQDTGLFRVVGIDWALFAAQAIILRSGDAQDIYHLDHIDSALQAFRVYTTDPSEPLAAGPVPYPPILAWLMGPLTFFNLPPPVGFGVWTLINVAGVVYLARRVADVLPGASTIRALLVLLVSIPVAQGLIVGQPTALLACAMAECYVSLRAGKDFRAGMWLAALLFKPQYGLLLGPILIWKARWRALAGVALGSVLVIGASLLLVGPSTLLSYTAALSDDAPFSGGAMTSPGLMVNWRALILFLRPSIGPETGLALTLGLGVITVLCLVPVWRGDWRPLGPRFPAQMGATLLATALANYHSHVHGAALLAVPLAAILGEPRTGRLARWAILALVFVPTVLVVDVQHWFVRMVIEREPLDVLIWSPVVQVLLVLAMAGLVVEVVRWRRTERLAFDADRHAPAVGPRQAGRLDPGGPMPHVLEPSHVDTDVRTRR